MSKFDSYKSIAEAMARLLHPHGEVVIHDLKTRKIAAIYNNFSKRKIGDESLIDDLSSYDELPDIFPVYVKTNWDGRKIRSCTAAIRDQQKKPIGLFCINLDVSAQEQFRSFLDQWLQTQSSEKQPDVPFKDDWREKINQFVTDYVRTAGITLKVLTRKQRYELVKSLYANGAFQAKNAAIYVAEVLNLSRATVYNYLRLIHENP